MNEPISARLAEVHDNLRQQLAQAEQHFERLEKTLAARESKDIARLNRAVRRLRSCETMEQLGSVLMEAAQSFAGRVALFRVEGNMLLAHESFVAIADAIPLDAAPAFRSAVETGDPVIAMRTRGEMSEPIAAALGEAPDRKFHLFPISTRDRVTAILYAASGQSPIQAEALELLASAAGAVLEGRAPAPAAGLVNIAENGRAKPDPVHVQAQRFARLQVAEMRLFKSDIVKSARESADLYTS